MNFPSSSSTDLFFLDDSHPKDFAFQFGFWFLSLRPWVALIKFSLYPGNLPARSRRFFPRQLPIYNKWYLIRMSVVWSSCQRWSSPEHVAKTWVGYISWLFFYLFVFIITLGLMGARPWGQRNEWPYKNLVSLFVHAWWRTIDTTWQLNRIDPKRPSVLSKLNQSTL